MKKDKQPENPNAFACAYGTDQYERSQEGMTLRDYFAAKAMQSILSNELTYSNPLDSISEQSYRVADSMLKAREQ